jgi:hypothetical protein
MLSFFFVERLEPSYPTRGVIRHAVGNMSKCFRPNIDGPMGAISILCPTLHAYIPTNAIPVPVWTVVRFPVIARDMLLHEPGALEMKGTVFARGASADKKMWMRLTAIAPSTEEIGVRQVEGVNIA